MKNIMYALLLTVTGLGACTKMDHEYAPYLSNGEIFYTGVPTNLVAHPGRGRVGLQFTQSKDPNIARYVIYWNNRSSKLEVPASDSVLQQVIVPNLTEGEYAFEIVAYDKAGNPSTPGSAVITGTSLGQAYENNLQTRRVNISNSQAGIILGFSSMDTTCKYTTAAYTTASGTTGSAKYTNAGAFEDTLKDASKQLASVVLKTAYVPLSGIDTFYAQQTMPVNLAAAKYTCTGQMVDYTNASLTGPYPWNVTLRPATATQLELVDNDQTNEVYHKILSGGSNSYYGSFGVVFNLDNNYNVISVINKYGQPSSNGRSAELDPSGINKFDPATRTLKVKYWMNQPGATHRTSFDETFSMK
ncbi:uncharacterized protein DUF4998 [Chitinophaga polysaccharea]|uniref:Uncharacterized protein DUF4998 n=1 Tax=Chitinophaga polysaccharea TaxID=1293035 RepID=A0A561PUJ5_9BACT|nr:DUF4998 domain-containing protein [Chitinophaga polysaccharea]TWF41786.1 uncharacterized protein DUF4998 [Chitinophaga polysaccharea]